MRILVFGSGVIGSAYAARFLNAGHEVTMLARDQREADLRQGGLILHNASTGRIETYRPEIVETIGDEDQFDLALIALRREQLHEALPQLLRIQASNVAIFSNAAGLVDELSQLLDGRALFGFPAVGGTRAGPQFARGNRRAGHHARRAPR